VRYDTRSLNAQARLQSDGLYRLLSCECVVVVVGNYLFADGFTRKSASSACTSGFATHVEAKSPPELWDLMVNQVPRVRHFIWVGVQCHWVYLGRGRAVVGRSRLQSRYRDCKSLLREFLCGAVIMGEKVATTESLLPRYRGYKAAPTGHPYEDFAARGSSRYRVAPTEISRLQSRYRDCKSLLRGIPTVEIAISGP
jgi:hypothetical protein